MKWFHEFFHVSSENSHNIRFRSLRAIHIQNSSNCCSHKYDQSISRFFIFGGFLTFETTVWRELVELLKGNFVDDDGSVVVMRHHEEVIPPLHCTAYCAPCQPIALCNSGPLSGPTSTALYVPGLSGGRKMYSNSSRSLCDLVSVAAAAATLRQFKLLQQLWKSNQLPC